MSTDAIETKEGPVSAPSDASGNAPPTARVRVNLTLSAVTHGKIKVWCAQRGVSMQAALEKMLDAAFDKVAPP